LGGAARMFQDRIRKARRHRVSSYPLMPRDGAPGRKIEGASRDVFVLSVDPNGPVASCAEPACVSKRSRILSRSHLYGVLAQLVERLNGIEEVRGSNPLGSTSFTGGFAR
jgi:hypothetical protein